MNLLGTFIVVFVFARNVAEGAIGVDWGTQSSLNLSLTEGVQWMLQNDIRQARIFTSGKDMLDAFSGSGIELTISMPDTSQIDTYDKAKEWVHAIQDYFVLALIRRIYVRDYAFVDGITDKAMLNKTIDAVQSLQKALNDAHFGEQVKVTVPHHATVLKLNKATLRPSEAEFRDEIKPEMARFLRILDQNNAPFVVTMNPYIFVTDLGIDLNFAVRDNRSSYTVKDVDGAEYTNAFELEYDSYVSALNKLNASGLEVVVGQVGWPTQGRPEANATMAERFYRALLPWVASGMGTTKRPGSPIDICIHSMFDEDMFYSDNSSRYEEHYGIFGVDGKPKYKIDLSGKGRDIFPKGNGCVDQRPVSAIFVILISVLGTLFMNL